MNTRIVVPLNLSSQASLKTSLNLIVEIDGGSLVVVTRYLASVPVSILKKPVVSLSYRSQ